MEKLIELLNEWEIEREGKFKSFKKDRIPYFEWSNKEWGDDTITYLWLNKENYRGEELIGDSANAVLISKHYGFVSWLVENDKIDFEGMSGHGKIISYLTDEKDYKWNDIKEGVVLMLLSISNSPIEDLISYLK